MKRIEYRVTSGAQSCWVALDTNQEIPELIAEEAASHFWHRYAPDHGLRDESWPVRIRLNEPMPLGSGNVRSLGTFDVRMYSVSAFAARKVA